MKKYIFFMLLLCEISVSFSQNKFGENQQKYWDYRNRLKKLFEHVGSGNGNSLILNLRFLYPHDFWAQGHCRIGKNHWILGQEDNPMMMQGVYLTIMATEYALLKKNHKDTRELLNEIYWALNAIERLDKNSDKYLVDKSMPENIDGNMLRTDYDFATDDDWQVNDDSTFTLTKSFRRTNIGFYDQKFDPNKDWCDSIVYNNTNIVSVDEIAGLMSGFMFVLKYVDNIEVQPDPTLPAHKLCDWVREITERIGDQWSSTKYWYTTTGHRHANWIIRNPASDFSQGGDLIQEELDDSKKIPVGGNAWYGLATPLAQIFSEITGKSYSDNLETDHVIITPHGKDLWDGLVGWPNGTAPSWLTTFINGDLDSQRLFNQWSDSISYAHGTNEATIKRGVGEKFRRTLLNYAILLMLTSSPNDTINLKAAKFYSDFLSYRISDLLYRALYPNQHDFLFERPRWWYDSLMNDAPAKHNPQWDFEPNKNSPPTFIDSKNWGTDDLFSDVGDHSGELAGFKNGMDYMLLYNLYHIVFLKDSLPYEESACDCWNYKNYVYDFNTFTQNMTLPAMHPLSHLTGVEDKCYINKSCTLSNPHEVYCETDIEICHRFDEQPSVVNIEGNLIHGVASDTTFHRTFRIRKDNTLISAADGNIKILKGATMIACPGSTLEIISGIQIQGTLIIEGTLKNHGMVEVDGGVLLIRNGGKIICDSNSNLSIHHHGQLLADSGTLLFNHYCNITLTEAGFIAMSPKTHTNWGKEVFNSIEHKESYIQFSGLVSLEEDATLSFHYTPLNDHGYYHFSKGLTFDPKGNNIIHLHGDGINKYLKISGNFSIEDTDFIEHKKLFQKVILTDGIIEGASQGNMLIYSTLELSKNLLQGPASITYHGRDSFELNKNIFTDHFGFEANLEDYQYKMILHNCSFSSGAYLNVSKGEAFIHSMDFNTSGISASLMKNCTINNCYFTNGGLVLSGLNQNVIESNQSPYLVESCNFLKYAGTAISAVNTVVTVKCCLFKGNDQSILIQNGYLNISKTKSLDNKTGGDNLFLNNTNGISVSNGGVYLNYGGNAFIVTDNFVALNSFNNYSHIETTHDWYFNHDTVGVDYDNCLYKSSNNFFYPQENYIQSAYISKIYALCKSGTGPHPPLWNFIPSDTDLQSLKNYCISQQAGFNYAIVSNSLQDSSHPYNGNILRQSDWHPEIYPNPIGASYAISLYNTGFDTKILWLRVIRMDGTVAFEQNNIQVPGTESVIDLSQSGIGNGNIDLSNIGESININPTSNNNTPSATYQFSGENLTNGIYRFLFFNTNDPDDYQSIIVIKQ